MNSITDPDVTFAALQAIADYVAVENTPHRYGKRTATADILQLRALSLQDLHRLAALRPAVASVVVDTDALRRGLSALTDSNRLGLLREEFIRKGASAALMRELFKLDDKATRRLRRQFRLKVRRGRPLLPAPSARNAIQAYWYGLEDADPRERYLALWRKFPEWSLDTLHAVVCEAAAARGEGRGRREDRP